MLHAQVRTFCESQARLSLANSELGSTVPRKMGLNWFIPALAKSNVGSWCGTTLLLGTAVCPLVSKKLMNAARTRLPARAVLVTHQGKKLSSANAPLQSNNLPRTRIDGLPYKDCTEVIKDQHSGIADPISKDGWHKHALYLTRIEAWVGCLPGGGDPPRG